MGPTYEVGVTTHNSLSDPKILAQAIEQYNVGRTGILTNVGGDVAGMPKNPPKIHSTKSPHPQTLDTIH